MARGKVRDDTDPDVLAVLVEGIATAAWSLRSG